MIHLLLFVLLSQDITATEVLVQKATSAEVIESSDYVEVILSDPQEQYNGFMITVPSPKKFVRVKAQKDLFTVITPKQINETQWLFTAPEGVYAVTVTQFDPETGIDEQYLKVEIGDSPPSPPGPDPPLPDPALPDLSQVVKLAPADVQTTLRLIEVFKTGTDPIVIRQRREEIMRTRDFSHDWNPFIRALNTELAKVDYIQGIRAVAKGLEARVTKTCVNGVCSYSMR